MKVRKLMKIKDYLLFNTLNQYSDTNMSKKHYNFRPTEFVFNWVPYGYSHGTNVLEKGWILSFRM